VIRRLAPPLLALALLAAGCTQEPTCAADQSVCGGACVSLQDDAAHCGACGHACGAGQGCRAGACFDCASSNGACDAQLLAACSNLNQLRPLSADLAPVGSPLTTDSAPIAFARLGDALYVANSLSSSISAITPVPLQATSGAASIKIPVGTLRPDLEYLAAHGGLLWGSNAAAGTLVGVDPAAGVVREIPLAATPGEYVNPQGIAFVGDKAYVALAGPGALAVVDVSAPQPVVARIPLQQLATGAAQAAPARVAAVGTRVYVTLNDYFDPSYAPVAGANGLLAVVDASTDRLVGPAVDLGAACLNASGLALQGTTLWVACGAIQFSPDFSSVVGVSGAALVPVELGGAAPAVGVPITSAEHALMSVAFCGGRGYAGASESGTVLSFDPKTRAVASALACPADPGRSSYVPDLACAR
jgi:hypothetical protein